MQVFILQANIFGAIEALLGLGAAVVRVLLVVLVLEDLLAVLAGLRSERAHWVMPRDFLLIELDLTVLTDDLSVRFFVMLIFFCLGNNVTTLLALVVAPGASHLMEAKLAQFDVFHAGATLFARLISCRYLVSFHYFNIQNLD